MKYHIFAFMPKAAAVMCLSLILSGCCCLRHQPEATVVTDSTRVEYRDRIVRDTVEVELPVIYEKNVTNDTLSVIENDYARTAAVVSGGRLWHDLQIKPAVIKVPFMVEVRDTVIVRQHGEVITRTVEVERKLTKMQSFWIQAGKASMTMLLMLVIGLAAYILLARKK